MEYLFLTHYINDTMKRMVVKNLKISFGSGPDPVPVVAGVSFSVEAGQVLALVGESGCGKSISCLSLTGLLPSPPARVTADEITFYSDTGGAVDLLHAPPKVMRRVRGGGIGYIFQEPAASLNPVFRIGDQIAEAVLLHRPEVQDVRQEVLDLLQQVGIPDPVSRLRAYPHELSGGMQQRVMIAMALAGGPGLLIADEPTTALDVTIQAQVLDLIDRTRRERNMAVVLVTHNLGIVAGLADVVAVMYAGQLIERGPVADVLAHPAHPYTRALLKAVPRSGSSGRLETIPGSVPPPERFSAGCRFCDRCPRVAGPLCGQVPPPEQESAPGHFCCCYAAPVTEGRDE